MKKRILSILIALVFLISGFSQAIFAANDGYGTAADGIKGAATVLTSQSTLKNGDFEEGLRYWGNQWEKDTASSVASVKTEDGNGYLVIDRSTADDAAKGVISVPVKISNAAVGDEIFVFFDYRVKMYDTSIAGTVFYVCGNSLESGTAFANTFRIGINPENVSDWTSSYATAVLSSVPENGECTVYAQIYLQYKAAAEINFDNVVIAIKRNSGDNVTPEGYYDLPDGTRVPELTLNPDKYGTVRDGISGNALSVNPFNTLKNAEFDEGLRYWGSYFEKGTAGSQASVEKDNENSRLVIERDTAEAAARGVISAPFKISGLAEGDVIAVLYDYKIERYASSAASTDYFAYLTATDQSSVKFSDGTGNLKISESNVLENEYIKTSEGWSTSCTQAVIQSVEDVGTYSFYIQLYMQYNAAGKLSFDNFRIYVKHNGETDYTPDGYYETLEGELISDSIFKGCTVNTTVNGSTADSNYPGLVYSWIGTPEDGIYTKSGSLGNAFPVRTKFMNSDFSKGLQYWFESASDGYTSDKVNLKTDENGDSYITVSENGGYCQINQTRFRLNGFNAGDKVYIMAKFRNFGNFGCNAYVQNAVDGDVQITKANGSMRTVYEPQSESEWGYSLSSGYFTIPDKTQIAADSSGIYGGEFSYYIMINSDIYAEISEIVLVVKNGDGSYTDSDGNIIELPQNTNSTHYSAADGFDWTAVYGKNRENVSDFWAGAYNTAAASIASVASKGENGIIVKTNFLNDGSLVFEDFNAFGAGIASAVLKLSQDTENVDNRRILFEYILESDYEKPAVTVTVSSGTKTYRSSFYGSKSGYTVGSLPIDFVSLGAQNNILFQRSEKTECRIKNITFGYCDKGGIDGLYAKSDGTPYGYETGDVNADGNTNILDLIRVKKYLACADTQIYFAAADCNSNGEISATDLSILKKALLKK